MSVPFQDKSMWPFSTIRFRLTGIAFSEVELIPFTLPKVHCPWTFEVVVYPEEEIDTPSIAIPERLTTVPE